MIIDGHAHSCGEFYDADKIINRLDQLKVDKVVLCPGIKNEPKGYSLPDLSGVFSNFDIMLWMNKLIKFLSKAQKPINLFERNEHVYIMHSKYPDRIIQFYWADPKSKRVLAELEEKYNLWSFKGIKLHQCFQDFEINSAGLDDIADFAEEKALPLFIHLHAADDAQKLISLAHRHPEVAFIIAHLIGLEVFIAHAKGLKNIFFDISPTPLISTERIYKAIDYFGPGKLILGSDTPFGKDNLKKNIERVNSLNISNEEKNLILGGNLNKLLEHANY